MSDGYTDWLRKYHQEDTQVNNDLWALMWEGMTQHHLITTAAHNPGLFSPFHSTIILQIKALALGYSPIDKNEELSFPTTKIKEGEVPWGTSVQENP